MKKNKKQKDHPEITDIKHICDITHKTKTTQEVCEKVSRHTDARENIVSKESTKKNKP